MGAEFPVLWLAFMRVEEDWSPSYNIAQSMIPVKVSMSLKCYGQPTLIMEKYVICFRPDRSLSEVYFKYKLSGVSSVPEC